MGRRHRGDGRGRGDDHLGALAGPGRGERRRPRDDRDARPGRVLAREVLRTGRARDGMGSPARAEGDRLPRRLRSRHDGRRPQQRSDAAVGVASTNKPNQSSRSFKDKKRGDVPITASTVPVVFVAYKRHLSPHSKFTNMNRRRFLSALLGGSAIIGGAGTAKALRLDITLDSSVVRGKGRSVTTHETITRSSVDYVEESGEVKYGDTTESFQSWAHRECPSVGAKAVLPAIKDRTSKPLESIGIGVRGLAFGLVITVDYTTTRDEDGSRLTQPDIQFETLKDISPNFVTSTVEFQGQDYTREVPVVVSRSGLQPV